MSCAGAYGVMQVMPKTAEYLNWRFGPEHGNTIGGFQDYKTLSGNTRLGSAYLQWSLKLLADNHFNGNYRLHPCATATEKCLPNAVISAFQVGADATDKALAAGSGYPNPEYIANVRWWMNVY